MPKSKLTDSFVQGAIANGTLTPPRVREADPYRRAAAFVGWGVAALGALALAVAYLILQS